MLSWIFSVFIWSSFFCEYSFGFFTDFEGATVNQSAKGKVLVTYRFEEGTFTKYCDIAMWLFWKCDPMTGQIVVVVDEFKSNSHYSKLRDELFTEFDYEFLQFKSQNEWKHKGFDVSTVTFYYDWDKDYLGPKAILTFRSDMYHTLVGICSRVEDTDPIRTEYLMSFCRFVYLSNTNLKVMIASENTWTSSTLLYSIFATCMESYFQPSCWRECSPVPTRYSCDSQGNEICEKKYSPKVFKYILRVSEDYYSSFIEKVVYLSHCLFYNDCTLHEHYPGCTHDYLCYPLGNNTNTCLLFGIEWITARYSSRFYDDDNALIHNDTIKIRIVLTGTYKDSVFNNSQCEWEIPDDHKYTNFEITEDGYVLNFKPFVQYDKYNFGVKCLIGKFRYFYFNKTYTINIPPTKIWLYNLSVRNPKYIYIGQIIKCMSNAVPQNISTHRLLLHQAKDDDETTGSRSILYIPYDAIIDYCRIECSHSFTFSARQLFHTLTQEFYFEIHSYVFFHWLRFFKNVYSTSDFAGCVFKAYFQGVITIKEVQSIGQMNILPYNNFSTYSDVGGIYRLLCVLHWQGENKFFYKPLTFELFYMPNTFCLLPYFPTVGTLLIVSQNGYPRDYSEMILTLFVKGESVISTRLPILKIPYNTLEKTFVFTGNMTFIYDVEYVNMFLTEELQLETKTSAIKDFTEEDFNCISNSDFQFSFEQLSDVELIFNAEITFLSQVGEVKIEMWYGIIVVVMMGFAIYQVIIRMSLSSSRIYESWRSMKQRDLNDKLLKFTKFAIEGNMVNVNTIKYCRYTTMDTLISKLS